MTSILQDRDAIAQHLNWLIQPAISVNPSLRLEIAWGKPSMGPNCAKTFRINDVEAASNFAAGVNNTGCNVYVGVTLKSPEALSDGRTKSSHASLATCLPIDIDGDFHAGLMKLQKIVTPHLVVMTGLTPEPRGQVWIGIAPTSDMDLWKDVNGRSVHFCGGDKNALGTYRLMRLAGTVSYPSSGKQARGYITELTTSNYYDAQIYRVEDLLNLFPAVSKLQPCSGKPQLHGVLPTRSVPVNPVNAAIVNSMLDWLPDSYVLGHGPWVRVGFALHSFDSFEIGLALWMKFSERDPEKYTKTDFPRAWGYFSRPYDGKRITLGWLIFCALKHGWVWPCRWDYSTILKLDGMS